jgi:hypothetical protein
MKTYQPGRWFALRAKLTKLFKRVFFAGEHIADWKSSVEGAVVAGKVAATVLGIDPRMRHSPTGFRANPLQRSTTGPGVVSRAQMKRCSIQSIVRFAL